MDKWKGKVAVVTGASAGIGADISLALAQQGMLVVGLARRAEALEVMPNWINFDISYRVWKFKKLSSNLVYFLLFVSLVHPMPFNIHVRA